MKRAAAVSSLYKKICVGNVGKSGKVVMISMKRDNDGKNTIDQEMIGELGKAFRQVNDDDSCNVLILSGDNIGGSCFSSGVDVKEMSKVSDGKSYMSGFEDIFAEFKKPIIAAVSGYALGGGCEMAMACDMIFAGDDAKFSQPEIKLGIIPGFGGTQRLTLTIGKVNAMELLLTGRHINAKEAKELGIKLILILTFRSD